MSHAEQDARANDNITYAATLCFLQDNYLRDFAVKDHRHMYAVAMDIADLCTVAALNEPPAKIDGWLAAFDTWLQRATAHALQAGALGRE